MCIKVSAIVSECQTVPSRSDRSLAQSASDTQLIKQIAPLSYKREIFLYPSI